MKLQRMMFVEQIAFDLSFSAAFDGASGVRTDST
jgi:hypothetical protein